MACVATDSALLPRHRIAATEEATAALAQRLAATGIAALGVHGRFVKQRPRDPAHWDRIRAVVASLPRHVPVIANGDVFSHADFDRICAATGAAAAMAARGPQWNASVFRSAGPLPDDAVRKAYVAAAVTWDNPLGNTKHVLREMLRVKPHGLAGAEAADIHAAKSLEALAAVYDIDAAQAAAMRAQAAEREAARRGGDAGGAGARGVKRAAAEAAPDGAREEE